MVLFIYSSFMKRILAMRLLQMIMIPCFIFPLITSAAELEETNPDYENAKMGIDNKYKDDKARCAKMQGNKKKVCNEKAEGIARVSQQELDAKRKGDVGSYINTAKSKIDTQYDLDKVRCNASTGKSKSLCLGKAKAKHEKARADVTLRKETYNAQKDANKKIQQADYDLAMKKCESLAGDSRDACETHAKKRYIKN
jgi:hypothetical protein